MTIQQNPDEADGHVKIRRWIGRLGNNIQQVCHAHMLAEERGCEVTSPPHPFFDIPTETKSGAILAGDFFNGEYRSYILDEQKRKHKKAPADEYREICTNKVRSVFKNNKLSVPYKVAIHIRNGDIFCPNFTTNRYAQPPLSYYTKALKVLNVKSTEEVCVVCSNESGVNPVLDFFIDNGYSIKGGTLQEAVDILTNVKAVVGSNSTFSRYLFYLNAKIERAVIPSNEPAFSGPKFYRLSCNGYSSNWSNKPEEIYNMLNFPESNIDIL